MNVAKAHEPVQLKGHELDEMKRLSKQVSEELGKMSRIALPELGMEAGCKQFAVTLPSGNKPLVVTFGMAGASGGIKNADEVVKGYYVDPPGVCTPIKPANA